MFKKTAKLIVSAAFVAGIGTAFAEEANVEEAQPAVSFSLETPEISEAQFQLERQFMIDDLTEKLEVMGTARDCAIKAAKIEEIRLCTDALREAILKSSRQ